MTTRTLIQAEALAERLDDPRLRLFDCRFDLARPDAGRERYLDEHLPGALYADLNRDLSAAATSTSGRHPLPSPGAFAARLRAWGVDRDSRVVTYDDGSGAYASRLWWMLRWVGHSKGAVLDGGFDAWVKAGQRVTDELPAITAATYTPNPQPQLAVDSRVVASALGANTIVVIDARSPDRFRGENETLDPVAGHIPGALNRFFRNNLRADGCFKSTAELKAEYVALLGAQTPATVVHQCGSGVTACHNLLAMEAAGLTGSRLYPGSWSEWVSERARPAARGDA